MAKSLSELDREFRQNRIANRRRIRRGILSVVAFVAVSAVTVSAVISLSGGLPWNLATPPVSSAPTVSSPPAVSLPPISPSDGQEEQTPMEEEYLVTVSGTVSWRHGDAPQSDWPDRAVILVLQGEEAMAELTVSEVDGWRFSTQLPRYGESGAELTYTLHGNGIPGYQAMTRGTEIEYIYENSGAGPETAGPVACYLWLVLTLASALALKGVIGSWRRE